MKDASVFFDELRIQPVEFVEESGLHPCGGSIEIGGTDGIANLGDPNEEEAHGAIYISEPGSRDSGFPIRLVTDAK